MFPPGAFCPLLRLSDPQRPRLRQRAITVPAAPVVRRMRVAGSGVAASGAGGFGSSTGPGSGAGGSLTGAGPGSGAGGSLTGAGPGSGAGGSLTGAGPGSGAGGSGAAFGSRMIGSSGASSSPPPPPPGPRLLAQLAPVAATRPATAIATDARRTQRANSLMNAVSSFLVFAPAGYREQSPCLSGKILKTAATACEASSVR